MKLLLYLVVKFLDLMLTIVIFAISARNILQITAADENNKLYILAYALSEPVIIPMRLLCEKRGWFQGLPIDAAAVATAFVLILVQMILEAIPLG